MLRDNKWLSLNLIFLKAYLIFHLFFLHLFFSILSIKISANSFKQTAAGLSILSSSSLEISKSSRRSFVNWLPWTLHSIPSSDVATNSIAIKWISGNSPPRLLIFGLLHLITHSYLISPFQINFCNLFFHLWTFYEHVYLSAFDSSSTILRNVLIPID